MAGPISGSGSNEPHPGEAAPDPERGARIGLVLFGIYLAAYTIFVVLNVFSPGLMEAVPFAGVNLAISYGMALIGGAFALALLYAFLLRRREQ